MIQFIMALARYSFSSWYIYEVGSDEERTIQIDGVGQYSIQQLADNFDLHFQEIIQKFYKEDLSVASKYDILELKLYLKHWMLFLTDKISRQDYNKKLQFLWKKGATRVYLNRGYLSSEIIESYGMNHKEKIMYVEKNRCFFKTCDDFDTKNVKVLRFSFKKIISRTTIEYKNKKQETIRRDINFPKLMDENLPLIVGETYKFYSESNTFCNLSEDLVVQHPEALNDFLNHKQESIDKARQLISNN